MGAGSGRILVVGAVAVLAGVFACTGGPGAPGDVDSPWAQKPQSTFEAPPSTTESPGSSLDPAPAPTDTPSPSGGGGGAGGCAPCGTLLCTGTSTTTTSNGQTSTSTVTVPIPFQKQADGSCSFTEKNESIVLTCQGTVTDANGQVLGTWKVSGTKITLASTDGQSTTCTLGGSSSSTAPSPTATVVTTTSPPPTVTPPPTASPPQPFDAGF